MPYSQFERSDLTLRDVLAVGRNQLANERTLLSYLRTAIMLIGGGATAIKLFADVPVAVYSGWFLIVIGVSGAALGTARYIRMRHAIQRLTTRKG